MHPGQHHLFGVVPSYALSDEIGVVNWVNNLMSLITFYSVLHGMQADMTARQAKRANRPAGCFAYAV